jgi:hypothetical protein
MSWGPKNGQAETRVEPNSTVLLSTVVIGKTNSSTMLSRSGESGTLVSFLTVEEMVSVFHLKYDVGCRCVIYSLYNVEVHSFYS